MEKKNKEFNILISVPEITSKKDMKKFLKPMYILEDYLIDESRYGDLEQTIRNLLRGCFHIKECREYPIEFKFYRKDKESYTLQIRRFLYNLYIWKPFCILNELHILDESYILSEDQIPNVTDFLNEKILLTLQDYNIDQIIINEFISNVLYSLRSISLDFSDIMNLTFSDHDFIEMLNNPEYREIMELKIPEDMQPIEVEKLLSQYQQKLVRKLKSDKENPVGIMLRAGSGMKEKQLAEYMIAMGLKPTLTGEVMPIPIETSSLLGGLNRPSYQYIDAIAARKPLIMNKKSMGNAGYFGKKVSELCRTVSLSNKVLNCHTKHLIKYEIKNKKYLMKLNGKFYKMNPDDEDYKVLNYKDTDLVGKTIYARGAQTCACGQNLICPTCLGKIADLNWDLKDGIGVFQSQELSKDIEQKILSGKHLLTTKSEKIEFNDEFYDYFTIAVGEISPALENIDNVNDLAIYVVPEEIEKVEEYDADSTYNTYISTGRFFIRNLKTKKDTEVKILKKKELYITSNVIKTIRNNNGLIKFKDLDEDTPVFEVIILNNELTKPLYELIGLLDSEKKETIEDSTIDTFSQRFLDIIIESGIGASMVAAEIVMNRLIRETNDVFTRPDFTQEEMPDYKIYTIRKILRNNESITIGLGFENLKAQLLNPNVKVRTAPSYMDAYFKEELPTSILKKFETDEPKKKQMDYYLNANH